MSIGDCVLPAAHTAFAGSSLLQLAGAPSPSYPQWADSCAENENGQSIEKQKKKPKHVLRDGILILSSFAVATENVVRGVYAGYCRSLASLQAALFLRESHPVLTHLETRLIVLEICNCRPTPTSQSLLFTAL